MIDEQRLADIMQRWRSAKDRGEDIIVDHLCQDCPELLEEVRRRLNAATVTADYTQTADRPHAMSGSVTTAPAPIVFGRATLGEFRLIRELGRGGMGIVYEAEDATLGRRVALKTLHPELAADEVYRQRFLREARAAAALRHDHVVTLLQVGQDSDTPFLVMEFLEGQTLEDRLQHDTSMPLPDAVRIAKEMAEGLSAAHAKGLVHRDVKPANVWLESPHGRVKLLDFGLARTADGPALTAHGAIAGTVGYMAPEQIYSGPLDGRTDVYALGCVLYQMLWGAMPFQSSNTMELLEAVVTQDAPNLDDVAKKVPVALGELLRQMLARKPDDRPASASDVARQLTVIETGLRKPGAPSTALDQVRKQPRRLGIWAGAGIVLLAAALGISALFNRFAQHPNAGSPVGLPANLTVSQPIKVGVLHSVSGMFRDSEKPMVEAIHLAADEINATGGVGGRPIQLIEADPSSIEADFINLAERLIVQDKVTVIFGCWTSSSRKGVAEVCRKHNALLVHSASGEGLEEHPNVIYVGGAPNLQLHEAINYARFNLLKKKFFLVGSEFDLYSHAAHAILEDDINEFGGAVVGNEYIAIGFNDYPKLVERINSSKADVILNTIDGASNAPFSIALRQGKIESKTVPTFWLGIGEDELGAMDRQQFIGDYAVTPYFHSLDTPSNRTFIDSLKKSFRTRQRVSDAAEVSYNAVYLWKQAVEAANSTDPMKVRDGFRGQIFEGPEGTIKIDATNLYSWRSARVGELRQVEGFGPVFVVVKETAPLAPIPFPRSRTRAVWEEYIASLFKAWGGWSRRENNP